MTLGVCGDDGAADRRAAAGNTRCRPFGDEAMRVLALVDSDAARR